MASTKKAYIQPQQAENEPKLNCRIRCSRKSTISPSFQFLAVPLLNTEVLTEKKQLTGLLAVGRSDGKHKKSIHSATAG